MSRHTERYRDVTEADIGKVIEVRDFIGPWLEAKLHRLITKDEVEYAKGWRVDDGVDFWRHARIEVKQYRDATEADIGKEVEVRHGDWEDWRLGLVLDSVDVNSKQPFCCDDRWFEYARIEVTE